MSDADNTEETAADDAIVSEQAEEVTASAGDAASATPKPASGAPASSRTASEASEQARRHVRKAREGVVVSSKPDKTVVVAVIERVRHPKYNKFVLQTKKLYAHDETNDVNVGDKVRVMETRPLSKLKRWRVTDVLERAK